MKHHIYVNLLGWSAYTLVAICIHAADSHVVQSKVFTVQTHSDPPSSIQTLDLLAVKHPEDCILHCMAASGCGDVAVGPPDAVGIMVCYLLSAPVDTTPRHEDGMLTFTGTPAILITIII